MRASQVSEVLPAGRDSGDAIRSARIERRGEARRDIAGLALAHAATAQGPECRVRYGEPIDGATGTRHSKNAAAFSASGKTFAGRRYNKATTFPSLSTPDPGESGFR